MRHNHTLFELIMVILILIGIVIFGLWPTKVIWESDLPMWLKIAMLRN